MGPHRDNQHATPEGEADPSRRLAGKVALVTGAASGIGRAAAVLLARNAATVICADINRDGAAGVAKEIAGAGGAAQSVELDVTSEDAWRAGLQQVSSAHQRVDILVNSAGISFAAPVAEMELSDWRRVMAVNLDGIFLGVKHALRVMRQQPNGGSIVNISSASGIKPPAGASAYATSKAAVCMFTKAVAKECQERGEPIRINAICPGAVKTPLWRTMPFFQELILRHGSEEAAFRAMEQSSPHGRFIEPEEIAQAVLYLVSDESWSMTGAELIIDRGYSL